MQPLDLNLATRPIRNNTLLWVVHLMALALVAGLSYWNVDAYLEHRVALRELRDNVESIEGRMTDLDRRDQVADRQIARHKLKYLSTQAERANDVILRKALSWTRLFNLLETILPYEVKMVSIRPVFPRQRRTGGGRGELPEGAIPVSVEGAAKKLESFFELEGALLQDPHFDRVEPDRTMHDEAGGVLFDLRFLYFPDLQSAEEVEEAGAAEATDEAESGDAGAEEPEGAAPEAPADGQAEDPAEEEKEGSEDDAVAGAVAADEAETGDRSSETPEDPPSAVEVR